MGVRNRTPRLPLLACLAALALPAHALALDWVAIPTASVATRLDDNYRLQPFDEREVRQTRMDLGAAIVAVDEVFEFRLDPRLVSLDFDDERELDRDDGYLDLGVVARDGIHEWSFEAGYASEGTLTSEFQDTGFTEVDIDRTGTSLATAWTATASERSRYEVAFSRQDVDYEYVFLSPLLDNRYSTLALSYVRLVNEGSSLEFSGFASRFETEGVPGNPQIFDTTESSGVTGAWAKQFSSSLQSRIGVGWYRLRVEGLERSSKPEPSLDLAVTKSWSEWTLNSAYSISLKPSSYGDMYRHENWFFNLSKPLTGALTFGISTQLADVEAEGLATGRYDRRYAQGGVSVTWRVAERLSLVFGLDSRAQEYDGSRRARSNAVSVGFAYRGEGMRT